MKRTILICLTATTAFLVMASTALAQFHGSAPSHAVATQMADTGDVDTSQVILSAEEIGAGWGADSDPEVTFSRPDNSSILCYWGEGLGDLSPEGYETVSLQVLLFPSPEEAIAFFDNPTESRFQILAPPPVGDVSRLMYMQSSEEWHGAYMQTVKGSVWMEASVTGMPPSQVTEKVQSLTGAMLQRIP